MRCVIRFIAGTAVGCALMGCGELQDRFSGYPTEDTTINTETASANEIADALNRLARIAVVGDDWEFLDPQDLCTVHVMDESAEQPWPLHLRGAEFVMARDEASKSYYAIMKHGDTPTLGPDGKPLRLFETDSYHDVFFAEGYLQALAKKCAQSQPVSVHPSVPASS